MTDFASVLSNVVKRNKLYVTQIASAGGVDRTLLSKVMKGERPLSPHTFKKILDVMNIPSEDYELLVRSFIEENFGYDKYLKYIEIFKKFTKYDETQRISLEGNEIRVDFHLEDNILSLHSQNDILNAARQIISDSVKSEHGKLYSNIPTRTMFEIMRHFPDKKLDFKHIIDNIAPDSEKFISFSNVFDLMSLGYISNYHPTSDSSHHLNQLYPNYIITDDYILFTDSEIEQGYLTDNKKVVEIYTEAFLSKYEHTTPYIDKFSDILMLKSHNIKIFNNKINKIIFVDTFGCAVTTHLTLDMWDQIAKPDVPNRDYLRDTTYQYYSETYNKIGDRLCQFSTAGSLAYFVNNGIVETMPKEFAYPLNKENRVKVLKSIYQQMLGKTSHLYIIDDTKIHFSDGFGIELFEKENNTGLLQIYYETENSMMHYSGNLNFNVDDPQIVYDLSDFLNCFLISDYCLSEEKSLKFLLEEIHRCEMLPDD